MSEETIEVNKEEYKELVEISDFISLLYQLGLKNTLMHEVAWKLREGNWECTLNDLVENFKEEIK